MQVCYPCIMKTKHTHQGTCQACGAVQAVDNTTKLIAKHGYQVAGFGFFNGVCQGSDNPPAELEVFLTYRIITNLLAWATEKDRIAELYANGVLMVHMHSSYSGKRTPKGNRIYHDVMMFGCTEDQIIHQGTLEIDSNTSAANMARSHIDSLKRLVLTRLGQPLYPVSHKTVRQFAVGDVVKLYSKDFVLVAPRYGMSTTSTPKFWKGYYKDDADKKMFFPTVRTLRSQN